MKTISFFTILVMTMLREGRDKNLKKQVESTLIFNPLWSNPQNSKKSYFFMKNALFLIFLIFIQFTHKTYLSFDLFLVIVSLSLNNIWRRFR